jgi:protein involved in polysaccharide export with SLBB domain
MMERVAFRLVGKCLVCLMICLFTGTVWAQRSQTGTGMNPSQMSNQQILMMWQQAQKGGRSQNDAIQQLIRSGMSPAEVNNFKKRLIQAQGSSTMKTSSSGRIVDSSAFMNDSSWVQGVPQMRKPSPYYGFDFFSNPDINFEADLNINPPKTYVLGPGDELTVSLTGLNETSISDKITRDGNFKIPYAGIVNLSGLTMEQAEQKIKAKMKTAYPALSTGRTQLYITIDNSRSISVYVIGESERPGKYTVSALSGFFNVLYLSQGPSQQGSLRKIELIRNNKLIETIDFYSFLQKGYLNKELRLENQDIIRFPVYNKRVILSGEVKRPAIYELLERETLADLLNYAGGFEGNAYTETAKVVQVGDKEKKVRDINITDFPNFIPKNADSVYIGRILSTYLNQVTLTGAVKRPGSYEITEGMTLSKLISNADGLREDAFTTLGYIKRRRSGNAEREMISFNLQDLKAGTTSDIRVVKDDSVFIQSRDSINDIPSITVAGNVRAPGIFEYRKGMSVEDVIMMAGGFTIDAANHKVEISRLEKNRADTLANRLSNTLIVDVDSNLYSARNKTPLEPLDYVFVPRLLNYRILGNVQIGGEVLNPGSYTLERRDETVQQMIARAGGITPYSSIANTQIYRNGIRVGTTVFSDLDNAPKLLLLPGDSIFIPRNISLVEVKGAVFNPQMLEYNSSDFLSYISNAGGTTDRGNLKKAYVQYANGINKKIGHFLFFRSYPKVLPGSKIIVPEKTEGEKKGLSMLEITALTGMLSALVSMIAVLK